MIFLQTLDLVGGDFAAVGSFWAFFIAYFAIMMLLSLVVYVYSALALMAIAKKTKTPNGWLAFIPIANVYLLTQMAGVSGLWTLIVLAPIVPIIGGLAMIIVSIWLMWTIAEKINFPGWTSLLLLIPMVNLVMLGIWAWSKK